MIMDQPAMLRMVELALRRGPFEMRRTADGTAIAGLIDAWRPHLVLLDVDLPDGGLLDRLVRSPSSARLPVIALTMRAGLGSRLSALEHGADDVLTVPFAPEELVARAVAVVRRARRHAVVPFLPVIRRGEMEIDILHRSVRVGASELHLTSMEQSLLYLLAANAGRVVTREEILDCLWGVDYVSESNVVDRHVRGLRVKLHEHWKRPRYIATVPGRGYRFLPGEPGSGQPSSRR
jgi:two-component system, OmpR family, KDP operon response regulator KdpE